MNENMIIGRVCEKHPEFGGLRLKNDRNRCVECARLRRKRCKQSAKARRDPNVTRYTGSVCEQHPGLNGERLISNKRCVACHNAKRHELSRLKYNNDVEYRSRYLIQRSALKAKWNRYAEYAATRRAALEERIPPWVDLSRIRPVYKEASERGLTVDHYYPLRGETVSGLHVHTNLQIIPQSENDSKGNKHPDEFYGE